MFKFAQEVIDYQIKDKFPDDLNKIVGGIFDGLRSKEFKDNTAVIKSKYSKQIEVLIKERFNLTVLIDPKLHMYVPAAIIPFSSDYLLKNSTSKMQGYFNKAGVIFRSNKGLIKHLEKLDKDRKKDFEEVNNKKGWIDTKRARVGGYLSEVKNYLIINFEFFCNADFSTKEVVSIILHEIGHAFTGLENHYKLTTTNTAISNILNDLNQNKPDKALYTYKRYFGSEDILEAGLNEDSEITDFYGPLASRYIKTLDSQTLNNKYDETNFEFMADNFSTKFGLGKELVTGLHKLHKKYSSEVTTTRTSFYALHFVDIMFTALLLAVSLPVGFVLLGLIFATSGKGTEDLTYDVPKDRYNRIRNTIIDNLKDPDLPADYSDMLVKQIESIDAIMQATIVRESIMKTLANFIKPGSREALYYIGIQQQAENALNNTLFVNAAKLKTI